MTAANKKATLSARFVDTVSDPGKYHDGNGTGLFLRVKPTGAKQWVQRLTIKGKRREIGLGSPPSITLAQARKLAIQQHGTAMQGGDPLQEKRAQRQRLSFDEAVEAYLAKKLDEFRNEKHRKQWRSTLNTYASPKIGRLQVADISTQDILRTLEPIWTDKTETASRLRGRIENVLSWATVAGHRTGDNPARWKGNLSELLPKPTKVAKGDNQPALALGDVSKWWRDLSEREGIATAALRFLALTAARSGEIRGMTWSEVDLEKAVWAIPATRMKNGREHRVALSKQAVELLQGMPRLEGSEFVFPAAKGGALSDMSLSAVMRRMQASEVSAGRDGYLDPQSKRPAVPHGLRSTFRQWAAEQGYPRDMAEIALAHFIGSEVERAYQRSDMLERRRDMMQAWAGFVQGLEAQETNVLKLRAG